MPNTPASDGAFGSRGSRQMGMQACPLGPLLADINVPLYIQSFIGAYTTCFSKKCKDKKKGKKKPPYKSNHTKVIYALYSVVT